MTPAPLEDHGFRYIREPEELEAFIDEFLPLIDGHRVALDIEEDREEYYNPSVALVQLTVGREDAILDPVHLPTELLVPVIEAVCLAPNAVLMHGGRNDVTGLKRDFGVGPAFVRDTQVAARFAGHTAFGLAALIERSFGITLDKSSRRSKWLRRPLTDEQLRYARADTHYLPTLWDLLAEEAREAGWWDAVVEECEVQADLPTDSSAFDPWGWRSGKGVARQPDDIQRRLMALWRWRDETAAALDLHPSRLLPPWAMTRLAEQGARAASDAKVKGLHPKARPHLDDSAALLDAPPDLGPLKKPRERGPRRPGPRRDVVDERVNRLAEWRRRVAEQTGLEPGFLAPRSVLEAVARADVDGPDGYQELADVRQWQAVRYGDDWFDLR